MLRETSETRMPFVNVCSAGMGNGLMMMTSVGVGQASRLYVRPPTPRVSRILM